MERPPTRPLGVDPILRFFQSFEIQNRLTKHGPVVVTSHVGCAICWRPENQSTIYGFQLPQLNGRATPDESPAIARPVPMPVSFVALSVSNRPDRMEGGRRDNQASGRRVVMKGQRPTQPKSAQKVSDAIIAKRYLELQRLRDEVRKAEISRPMDAPYSKDQAGPHYRAPNTA